MKLFNKKVSKLDMDWTSAFFGVVLAFLVVMAIGLVSMMVVFVSGYMSRADYKDTTEIRKLVSVSILRADYAAKATIDAPTHVFAQSQDVVYLVFYEKGEGVQQIGTYQSETLAEQQLLTGYIVEEVYYCETSDTFYYEYN